MTTEDQTRTEEEGTSASMERAAWHGLATNRALPVGERLECALKALDSYEAEVERTAAIVEAAKTYVAAWKVYGSTDRTNITEVQARLDKAHAHQALLGATRAGEVPHGE